MEIAGIDADKIIKQLMAFERRPINALETRKKAATDASNAISRIKTDVTAYQLAAKNVADPTSWNKFSSTVSNDSAISATVGKNAAAGTLSFTVDRLAQAHGMRSVGTVAASSVAVTSEAFISIASNTRDIGIGTVKAGAGLGAGDTTLKISQASAAAATTGTPVATSTTISAANNTLNISVNGTAHTVTIADGTYDRAGLADAVNTALTGAGVAAKATMSNTGELGITTNREGSAATLQVTGGNALANLGLSTDAAARTGTDGIIDVDGTLTTVTQVEDGHAVAIDTGAGTLDVTLSGGLRVGTTTVTTVDTGDRSLSDVASAINGARKGVTAAAVKVADGQWRLQLNSTSTGQNGQIAIDTSIFGGIGGMVESSAATDAKITIGSGPGAYSVEASGNTFTDVMPGVSLTAKEVSTNPVSVNVTADNSAIADEVGKMVSALNKAISAIKVQTRFDPATKTSGALAGNATIRSLGNQLSNALANPVAGSEIPIPSMVGIERDREGVFRFDKAKFTKALEENPEAVQKLFARGGTETGDATFANATAETRAGSYAVEITTAATKATSGVLFAGGAAANSRLGIKIGDTTATVDVSSGDTAAQIIDKLNVAFADSGLKLTAEASGTGLEIKGADYGTAGNFELNTDLTGAGTYTTYEGTNVAGTIDGVAATGIGQTLSLSKSADSEAKGLSVNVTEGMTGAIGNVEYNPGIAARIVEFTTFAVDSDKGLFTSAKSFEDNSVKRIDAQIERYEDRLAIRERNLRRQWSAFQTVLSGLQNQAGWVGAQLANLPRWQ